MKNSGLECFECAHLFIGILGIDFARKTNFSVLQVAAICLLHSVVFVVYSVSTFSLARGMLCCKPGYESVKL